MGNCNCRISREEMVSRCKARKKYMKQLVESRQAFSSSHSIYIRSLRNTGSALLQFATTQINNHHLPPPPPPNNPTPPPPPPPMSPIATPSSSAWTIPTVLPPPPPQAPVVSAWDFWDQFIMPPSSSRSETEEEWEMSTTTTGSETNVAAPPPIVTGEMAVVAVSCKRNELFEIMKELDECFINAANAGASLSSLLEVSSCNSFIHPSPASGKNIYGNGKGSSPIWSWGTFRKTDDSILNIVERNKGEDEGCDGVGSHSSTVEKLYVWEKKLYSEVKNSETLKGELEKKTAQLKKLEINRSEHVKTKKIKNEVEKLELILMVSSQSIDTISCEIIKLRETNLYPQLLELVKRSTNMWKTMYENHQIQIQIVKNLKNLNTNTVPSTDSTSEIHQQSTLHLEQELNQWHLSFNNLMNSQRDYIQALAGWLRLSLFPLSKTGQDSSIYSLCEELLLAINRVPDKVASEGIKNLLNVIHDLVVQQGEELKQRKKSELVDKHLEKKLADLKTIEESMKKDRVSIKQEKVEAWKAKADEERIRHERLVGVTRATTVNNLHLGLPQVFEAMMGFSKVCVHAYESVYNRAKITLDGDEVKKL